MKHSDQIVLDLQVGRQLRDEGMALVLDNTPNEWKMKCEHAIELLAAKLEPFDAEDVREICGDPPRPNSMGAMFSSAVKRGLIRHFSDTQTKRHSSHVRRLQVWIGIER